jgi:hypothetical protein
MSFHRGGAYAVNMGLDSDNVLRIGGWSAPANRWQLDMDGVNTVAASHRAPIFYDSNDTSYYVDPNSTSELSGFSNGTKARAGLNIHHFNRQTQTGDTSYWVGSQGWGTTYTWNSALTILGSCFMDHWGTSTGHPQGSGYVHAQGLQILHYRDGGGGDTNVSYGWQMVGAHDAGNRWWLRGKWYTTIKPWYEIVTYGTNVGGTLYPAISYDSDNTGYYVDANSTSNLNVITATNLIGQGQTWQNVVASRAAGTLYTNSTSRPITVIICCAYAQSNMTVYVDSVAFLVTGPYGNSVILSATLIVPPGSTYKADSVSYWMELR